MNVKNILPVFVLAVLTIVVPLGSWYYLSTGLQYQKTAFALLSPKDSFAIKDDSLSIFRGKISVISGNAADPSINQKLVRQFEKVEFFQLLKKDSITDIFLESNPIHRKLKQFPDDHYILIDASLRVRNTYPMDSESIKSLVAHIALILPRKKEADIQMKK